MLFRNQLIMQLSEELRNLYLIFGNTLQFMQSILLVTFHFPKHNRFSKKKMFLIQSKSKTNGHVQIHIEHDTNNAPFSRFLTFCKITPKNRLYYVIHVLGRQIQAPCACLHPFTNNLCIYMDKSFHLFFLLLLNKLALIIK